MGRIKRNYLYSLAYQLLVLLTPIITAPYLARTLGASKLGVYGYVSSSGSIISTIALMGIYAYGNRQAAYVRDNRDDLSELFWEIMETRVLLGTLGTVIYLGYAFVNRQFTLWFVMYYPFMVGQFIDCSWLYVGVEDMKPAMLKNFIAKLINVIGIFIFIKTPEDIGKYILIIAITTFFADVSIFFQLPRYVDWPKRKVDIKISHIKGSLNLFLPQVASLLYLQIDKVMLQWLTGTTDQVSYYDQAEKIVSIPLTVITVLSTVMMPRIANEYRRGNKEAIADLLISAGRFALLLAMPMMVGIFCIARQFVPWYLGENFMPTSYAMMILVPIILFNSLSGISGSQYFTATDNIPVLMKAYVSAAVLNIFVNALLIPRLGYVGAAVATVLSSGISVFIQYRYLNQEINIKPLFSIGLKYCFFSFLMGIIILLITQEMTASVLTTVVQVCIGIVIYLVELSICKDKLLYTTIEQIRGKMRRKK